MRLDPEIVSELKGILGLNDMDQIKGRITSLIAAMEEPQAFGSGSTTSIPSMSDNIGPQSELARQLHDILEESDVGKLSKIVKEQKSVASITLDAVTGATVLHRAVELGNSQIVDILMSQMDSESSSAKFLHNLSGELLVSDLKRKMNARTKVTGYTPLHFAVSSDNDRVVAELIRRGADPDQRSTDDQAVSPFLLACELGQETAVRMMAQATQGRCVDSTDAQGNTGLHLAAENGHAGIVQVVMSVMPQLEREENQDGMTAAQLARPEISRLISEIAKANTTDTNDQSGGGFFFG